MKFALVAILALLPATTLAAGEFSYKPDAPDGPQSWATLDIPGNQCGGNSQSGIDVPLSSCDKFESHTYSPGTCAIDDMQFRLFDHAIQADYVGDCTPPSMTIPGLENRFEALQFHIHTGTDHALDGTYFGAAMHLVHKEVNGDKFAVLGFFLEPTSPSDLPQFEILLEQWEAVGQGTLELCGVPVDNPNTNSSSPSGGRRLQNAFNPYSLIPDGSTIYFYDGSLTTPPCSEVVWWNVLDKPTQVSVREYLRLTNLILDYVSPETCELATVAAVSGFTGRPVQPINGRTITRICPKGFVDQSAPQPTTAPTSGTATAVPALAVLFTLFVAAAHFF